MKTKLFSILVLSLLLFEGCGMTQHTVEAPPNVNVPENVLFLAQSGTQNDLFQTVIDLKNNEMVVLRYSRTMLTKVYRTGIMVNPGDYRERVLKGSDAPFGNRMSKSSSQNQDDD
jgi:hypothetical protein